MLNDVLKNYDIKGKIINIEENTSGNINKTYIVSYENNNEVNKYLVQRINNSVFAEPYKLMKNIEGITSYINKKYNQERDINHTTLEVLKTKDNNLLCEVGDNKMYYRIYKFINNAVAYNQSEDINIVRNTGKAFGNFQKILKDYPLNKLEETIKDFHNTPMRLNQLLKDIKIDPKKRALDCAKLIVYILQREDNCYLIMDKLGTEEIPLRVTHNDTKVNNVLMNKETGDFMAVIDLDTVMPGSLLFDYGDGIRSSASNSKEDEKDLAKVYINLDLFKAYTEGFMSEMADYLTGTEVSLMAESIRIITLELAIRFLNDYINGDTYFKIDYENHNLDRAINQLKLVSDIENKIDYMNNYITECYNKYKNNNINHKCFRLKRN